MEEVKAGVVGCGSHSTDTLFSVLKWTRLRLDAVCDLRREYAERNARLFGAESVYTDLDRMLEERPLDAVCAVGPPAMHQEVAMKALARGLHVFVEKPPAPDTSGYEAMLALARERSLVLMTGIMKCHALAYREVRRRLTAGEFTPRSAVLLLGSWAPAPGEFKAKDFDLHGYLRGMGIHVIGLAMGLFGEVASVSSFLTLNDDGFSLPVVLQFRSGVVAQVLMECAPRIQERVEALGTIPETLKVDSVELTASKALTKGLHTDLMFILPPNVAKTVPLAAYCFGEFTSPIDGVLYVNMSADWMAEWTIDGKQVYSTMKSGNGTRGDQWWRRGFSLPVTKGKHTVAVLCKRNRWGWSFHSLAGVGTKSPGEMQEFFQLRRTITLDETSLIQEDPTLEPAPPVLGTETEALIGKVKAPARFAKYVPRFRVEMKWGLHENSFTNQVFVKRRHYEVYDGERHVSGVAGRLVEMNPLQPWNVPKRPDKGFRYVNTGPGCPIGIPKSHRGEVRQRYCVAPDGTMVTYEKSWLPPANAPNAWQTCRSRSTLRVDPVCGYVMDVESEFVSADAPSFLKKDKDGWISHEWFNVMPSHLHYTLTKPVMDWRYERTMYCNRFTDKYRGWVTDEPQCQASDNHEGRFWKTRGLPMRDGGFIAFSKDPQGWSLAASRRATAAKVEFYNMTCHLLQDQHNQYRMRPPAAGKPFRLVLPWRMMNLPPEVTDYLLDRVEMYLFDSIMLRRGELRDFESDARRENEASPWSPRITVAEGEARSGKAAAVFRNTDKRKARSFRVNLDTLPVLDYSRGYRLEGWVKVQGEGAKAWFSIQPPFMDERYWRGPKLQAIDGEPAKAGDGWQKITVEFKNHAWHGWSFQPQFRVEIPPGGAVYLDDMLIN